MEQEDKNEDSSDYDNNKSEKKIKRITKVVTMEPIESVSERNEKSSNSTNKKDNFISNNKLKNAILPDISKCDNGFHLTLRKTKRQTLDIQLDKKINQSKLRETKKNISINEILPKHISLQQQNDNSFYNTISHIKISEAKIKRTSMRKTMKDQKKEKVYDHPLKNNNHNLSRTESFVDNKYFSNKKLKLASLSPNKMNFRGQKDMHTSNLFQKLKNTDMFEKSENRLIKLKICYAFLSVFSLVSILLEITDVILYNKNSDNYLKSLGINSNNSTDIDLYYLIEERPISRKENIIRIFNLIFSILCVIFLILIHYVKININPKSKKRRRYNYYINYNSYSRKKRKNGPKTGIRDLNNNDNHIKLILNEDSNPSYEKRSEIILLVLNCVIGIIFFPPYINKVFIGKQHKFLYVYSLNSLFLVISLFKIMNIYKAVFYLIPFNNLLYKTICSSNMVKMNFRFLFKSKGYYLY